MLFSPDAQWQLVESVLDEMAEAHRGEFHVVRLNGFIHTDDKLAVKEIWQQLGKELEEEEEQVGKVGHTEQTHRQCEDHLTRPAG